MAWASVGRAGSTGNTGNNQASIAITLNGVVGSGAAVGDLLVLALAKDNTSSVNNVDNGDITGVVDGASNRWIKAREVTAGGGAAQAGAICSMWYSHITNAISTTQIVTASFSDATSSDASAGIVWRFSKNAAASVRLYDTTHVVIATSSAGVLDLAAPSATEHLRVRAVGSETTLTALTTTAGWTTIGTTRSGTAVGAEVAIFGEFLITSNSTAASNPSIAAAADNASIMALFEENLLMGAGQL